MLHFRSARHILIALGLGILASTPVQATGPGLQTISLPQGGNAIYGPLLGPHTLGDGMVFMLHQVHGHYKDKPQLGRLFRVRGANSVATFFTLTDNTFTHRPLSGMVIVTQAKNGALSAAVLTDSRNHFSQSLNPLLTKVSLAMGGSKDASATRASLLPAARSATLSQTRFSDGSGSLGLPQGWQIKGAYQGAVHAEGQQGQSVTMGQYLPIMDSNNPQQRSMIQMETQGGRVPLPGMYTAYPYGGDLLQTFFGVQNQMRQKNRLAPMSLQKVIARTNHQGGFVARVIVDMHDQHGPTELIFSANFVPPGNGLYGMVSNILAAPQTISSREMPTLMAMANTYKTNQKQIDAEVGQAIGYINEIGRVSAINAANADTERQNIVARGQAIDDVNARTGAGFTDYQRDEAVVGVTGTDAHVRTDNVTAEALVAGNPARFEYVPTSQYIKGEDY